MLKAGCPVLADVPANAPDQNRRYLAGKISPLMIYVNICIRVDFDADLTIVDSVLCDACLLRSQLPKTSNWVKACEIAAVSVE